MKIDNLIVKCIQKNPSAEKELYYLYARRLYGICRRYSRDDQESEDYLQDAFVKIFSNLSRFDSDKGAFSSWASRVTINVILSAKRKKKIPEDYREISDLTDILVDNNIAEDVLQSDIAEEELLSAIRKLPDAYRDVVNLFVFEDWSHKQISEILNIKESSSRSRFTRAKKLLKSFLSNKLPILL